MKSPSLMYCTTLKSVYKALFIPNQVLRISTTIPRSISSYLLVFTTNLKQCIIQWWKLWHSAALPWPSFFYLVCLTIYFWYMHASLHQHIAVSLALFHISLWISSEQGINRGLELDFKHILFILILIYIFLDRIKIIQWFQIATRWLKPSPW